MSLAVVKDVASKLSNHKDWAEQHPGILLGAWASETQKLDHFEHCLNKGALVGESFTLNQVG